MKRMILWLRRLGAFALAGAVLWGVAVTAGSPSAAAAWRTLRTAVPVAALRWELGDWWVDDDLSPATVLTLAQAPLLLAARAEVSSLWQQMEEVPEQEEPPTTEPIVESPLDPELPEQAEDNGVPAKTLVPTDPSGYLVCGRVFISNSTDYPLTPAEVNKPFSAALTAEEPQILILHTHGSEAYTPAPGTEVVWSGDHRTTDSRYNVVHVGDEMAAVFAEYGLSVLHDRTLYDYPNYSGAYDRSLAAIESYLAQYPSIRFILDVHRDAIEDTEGQEYKVVSALGEAGTSAQLSLVLGTDGSGLPHDHWRENLRLAAAIQDSLLQHYPTLMRPLLVRNSRYNQHATTGSLLVEVGAAGNSPEEAVLAGRLFAQGMAQLLLDKNK